MGTQCSGGPSVRCCAANGPYIDSDGHLVRDVFRGRWPCLHRSAGDTSTAVPNCAAFDSFCEKPDRGAVTS